MPLTRLGRAPTNTVHLPDSFASNEHAIIAYRSGNWCSDTKIAPAATVPSSTGIASANPSSCATAICWGSAGSMLRVQIED
jgi:hypothetical protein